jgi:xylulokinase
MYLLGIDLGSSSVKASILDAGTGSCIASASSPESEQEISSPRPGFAEQDPATWRHNAKLAVRSAQQRAGIASGDVKAVGIAYQMHGLVCVDASGEVLRPAIIWCDSRAVAIGDRALESIGEERCLTHHLNSPGNFTASKLAWIKEHEPEIFRKIHKIMLVILEAGGLAGGGINFDARTRRNSTDLEDIFIAHIGGMDVLARALVVADRIMTDSPYRL